ncbi:hypothetical protein OCH239_15700 [Roseivivax halodurans JCM 10272]|uniref:Phosphate transport system permease protein PstA n=1 Tax=Roseivivax halodurans JCM 10272 TaxID=1449350 RepID=X7ECB0_9RHOB|nr:phosphate ABC transporter permease PstA [Roseivivax halodurans]ETX12831.1 hypothetical protein OCH239_15700 [Roseivivax halodurans JCM 10272]
MTDATAQGSAPGGRRIDSDAFRSRLATRRRKGAILKYSGLIAICIALAILGTLLFSIVSQGWQGFLRTNVELEITYNEEIIGGDAEDIPSGAFQEIARNGLQKALGLPPEAEDYDPSDLNALISSGVRYDLQQAVRDEPELIGRTAQLSVPVSSTMDMAYKGKLNLDVDEGRRQLSNQQLEWFNQLQDDGRLHSEFYWGLFSNSDSRSPELAGLWAGIVGSFVMIGIVAAFAFPIAVAAAVYLEEFAPKNRWTELVEVNINNLAAVPSIIFGLLGLAVFLNTLGFPRSSPLAGGAVLVLMTLPIIIIAARSALRSVPPSYRDGALMLGASRNQAVMKTVLPTALPGMLTGTIIGLAQALGETAPLLLIGMQAFVAAPPEGINDTATAIPVQIYLWANAPERGFAEKTQAAIMVLLMFLLIMNATAIILRNRFQKRA